MTIKDILAEVEEIKKGLENLGCDELEAELSDNPGLLLLDIREIQERVDLGTIPGAKHAPRGMLEFWADPKSPYYRDWFAGRNAAPCSSARAGRAPRSRRGPCSTWGSGTSPTSKADSRRGRSRAPRWKT